CSSRRRHTRSKRDWSSDVCSSDLHAKALATLRTAYSKGITFKSSDLDSLINLASASEQPWQAARLLEGMLKHGMLARNATSQERSEERRVGKECTDTRVADQWREQ